jgi:hypothetical protein
MTFRSNKDLLGLLGEQSKQVYLVVTWLPKDVATGGDVVIHDILPVSEKVNTALKASIFDVFKEQNDEAIKQIEKWRQRDRPNGTRETAHYLC